MPTDLEPYGDELVLTSFGVARDFTQVALTGGGFVNVWYQDVPGDGIFFRLFDAVGEKEDRRYRSRGLGYLGADRHQP